MNYEALPSGLQELDHALGIGGYPKGRVTSIEGPRSSLLALRAVAECQAQGGRAALVDVGLTFTVDQLDQGVGLEVYRPTSAGHALTVVAAIARAGDMDLVVLDAITGLTDAEASQALRGITASAYKTNTTIIITSTGPLSRAFRFYSTTHLNVVRESGLGEHQITIMKNKCAPPPFTKAVVHLG